MTIDRINGNPVSCDLMACKWSADESPRLWKKVIRATRLGKQVGHQPELGLDHLGHHLGGLVLAVVIVQPGNTERLGSMETGLPEARWSVTGLVRLLRLGTYVRGEQAECDPSLEETGRGQTLEAANIVGPKGEPRARQTETSSERFGHGFVRGLAITSPLRASEVSCL